MNALVVIAAVVVAGVIGFAALVVLAVWLGEAGPESALMRAGGGR